MRKILFRGKTIETREWLYGDYQCYAGCTQIWQENDDGEGKWNYLIVPDTVGQYIGLKDKNGNRIFEGDILDCHEEHIGYGFMGVVEFGDGSFRVRRGLDTFNDWMDYECEVIGNIYDNPELLEANNG